MSAVRHSRRITVPEIAAHKGGERIVCLTAYNTATARLLDPFVDILLVGDSLGMVLYGFDTTLPVTLEMMSLHGKAVVRGSERACVVVDLPFGSYQQSPSEAFRAAARIMSETGCAAVKLEGGVEMADTIAFLVERGVPVLGHVGLQPQSVMKTGGYRARGKSEAEAARLMADSKAIADAGAFGLVLECMVESLARRITSEISIPTIGIGASPACDGQILVTEDMAGLTQDVTPRFVKRYADVGRDIAAAAKAFAAEVRAGAFPRAEHCYGAEREARRPEPKGSGKRAGER